MIPFVNYCQYYSVTKYLFRENQFQRHFSNEKHIFIVYIVLFTRKKVLYRVHYIFRMEKVTRNHNH